MGGNSIIARLRMGFIALVLAVPGLLSADPIVSEIVLAPDRTPYFEADWLNVPGLHQPALEPFSLDTVTHLLASANDFPGPRLISLEPGSRQLSDEESPETTGMTDLKLLILAVLLVGGIVRYITSPHFIAILRDVFGPLHEY